MKYRAVYQPKTNQSSLEVVAAYENDSNVITTTGQTFLVDEVDSLIWKLSSTGVDFSFMWKNGIIGRVQPVRPEIDISDHPNVADVKRKVSVYGTNPDYNNERFRFNVLVRHFDSQGTHLVGQDIDDVFVSRIVDNSQDVDDGQGGQIGEYDFFYQAIQTIPLPTLEDGRIPIMDANGIFNDIY